MPVQMYFASSLIICIHNPIKKIRDRKGKGKNATKSDKKFLETLNMGAKEKKNEMNFSQIYIPLFHIYFLIFQFYTPTYSTYSQ